MLSPLPRRMTRGTVSGSETSAYAAARSSLGTSWMASGFSPASVRAGVITWVTKAWEERRAAEPVRSTPPLRDLRNWEATSSVTFGRASKFAPMTPTGRRRSSRTRPSPRSSRTLSRGSCGTSASVRSAAAMSSSRGPVSRRRSCSAADIPLEAADRRSSWFAAVSTSRAVCSRSAMARSAVSISPSDARARAAEPRVARTAQA